MQTVMGRDVLVAGAKDDPTVSSVAKSSVATRGLGKMRHLE